jgi:hypothetical protein
MPQGKQKPKMTLPANIKKLANTSKVHQGKVSKTNLNKKRKTNSNQGKTGLEAVQHRLTTQIAKNIEQECAGKVKANEGKSLTLVKSS